jgi:hypothetical protein
LLVREHNHALFSFTVMKCSSNNQIVTEILSMGTWEHTNTAGSLPPPYSLGIFCWGEIPQKKKRNKKKVFWENQKS